ncbi:MAG: hypothetical protein AAF390_19685 [Pseudomonadota bacterium]
MKVPTRIVGAIALLALAACGEQQISTPFNILGPSRAQQEALERLTEPVMVDQVLELTVDPTPGGVIVSAVGLPPTQGFWEPSLVPVPTEEPSLLLLDFQLAAPLGQSPVGTQPSREVLVGTFYSRQELGDVQTIAVRGTQNSLSASVR